MLYAKNLDRKIFVFFLISGNLCKHYFLSSITRGEQGNYYYFYTAGLEHRIFLIVEYIYRVVRPPPQFPSSLFQECGSDFSLLLNLLDFIIKTGFGLQSYCHNKSSGVNLSHFTVFSIWAIPHPKIWILFLHFSNKIMLRTMYF